MNNIRQHQVTSIDGREAPNTGQTFQRSRRVITNSGCYCFREVLRNSGDWPLARKVTRPSLDSTKRVVRRHLRDIVAPAKLADNRIFATGHRRSLAECLMTATGRSPPYSECPQCCRVRNDRFRSEMPDSWPSCLILTNGSFQLDPSRTATAGKSWEADVRRSNSLSGHGGQHAPLMSSHKRELLLHAPHDGSQRTHDFFRIVPPAELWIEKCLTNGCFKLLV